MMNTFQFEEDLPHLPVPLLQSTTQQLLSALKPLLSQEEYEELLLESSQFVSNDLINLLQSHLIEASKNPSQYCYLNCINDETNPGIYGELRGDILPRNPFLILEEDPYSKTINPPNQAQRASNLINSSLKFIVSLRNETLKPDLTPKSGHPLTMNCYKNLFGTTRIPDLLDKYDQHVTIKKYKNINDSRHIIIICKNQYFKLEVLTPFTEENEKEIHSKHKLWFNDHELSIILQRVIDISDGVNPLDIIHDAIGSLTTQSFDYWKLARLELTKSNAQNLEIIDDALFVVVLDSSNSPQTDQEKTSILSHGSSELLQGTNFQVGSCTSRWYDKLQLIVTKNAVAAVVWESTSMDSTAILRFISDIYTDLILKLAKNINGSEYTLFDSNVVFVSSNGNIEKPVCNQLKFNRTPELLNLVHLSETKLTDLINQHEYETMNLKLESNFIKDISIDSMLQISLQIAHYSLYGKIVNTLEPITTRKFRDARTELITVQNDSVSELVKYFIANPSSQKKWEMFKECCVRHKKQYQDAMMGKGFDRHFISLVHIIKRPHAVTYLNKLNKHLPAIPDLSKVDSLQLPLLSHPIIDMLSAPELLVSNCGNNALHLFGIPPAIDQGFGIGYIIHNDKVVITASSKYRQTKRFLDTLRLVVSELKNLLKENMSLIHNISDSKARKSELKELGKEPEHKIDSNSPLTRHPILLTTSTDSEPISFDKYKDLSMSDAESEGSSSESASYDLLGGYGYFDFGEMGLRSEDLSRTESHLNSLSGANSTLGSRRGSSSNLLKLASSHSSEAATQKFGLSLSERIRDKLSMKEDSQSDISERSETPRRSKREIGKQLGL
ncbi:uncharacterized protein PRCAT00000292001 [Priceomyces carsonii]|uniref:uncharacterized protein n=1 Tax=Priceomyces carsonii TaxID=28549 RepID=UPI002ED87DC7|nr:unnamed protein product [Priceomyces carsonii]